MLKVLAVCGAGMGTSMLIKMKVQGFFDNHKVDAQVESCGLSEASNLTGWDIVICSGHLAEQLTVPENVTLVCVENMMDENEYAEKLKNFL